jgi:hypothetical protein
MSTVTEPTYEQEASDEIEFLAGLANDGWNSADQARALCPLLPAEQFPLAWLDFCQAAADRDAVAPPATKHWTEVLGEDAASSQEQAYELLCQRADEALLVLTTGIRGSKA